MPQPSHHAQRRGVTLTGYGLLVGLIAVAALATTTGIGSSVTTLFDDVGGEMQAVVSTSASAGSEATPDPTPEGPPTGLYAVFDFENDYGHSGFGTDVSVQSFGTQLGFSTAQVYQGSRSLFVDSTSSGDPASRVYITLPELLNRTRWEIRMQVWQDNSLNTMTFPSVAYFGRNEVGNDDGRSYMLMRYGPNATAFAAYLARDSAGQAGGTNNITAHVVNQNWAELAFAYTNGLAELKINGSTVASMTLDTATYPFGNDFLSLGQVPNLGGGNGFTGFIDRVEVEIFE